jgi:hypothetical protein
MSYHESIMVTEDYKAAWEKLVQRKSELEDRRTDLETQLSEVQNELAHVEEIVNHLAPLAGYTQEPGSIFGLGITDAIRAIFTESPGERFAPSEIYKKLQDKGFNFASYTQPMASIYKILARLKENGEVIPERENYKVFYSWVVKVSDEDIPF